MAIAMVGIARANTAAIASMRRMMIPYTDALTIVLELLRPPLEYQIASAM
jgi:hypothetical protein